MWIKESPPGERCCGKSPASRRSLQLFKRISSEKGQLTRGQAVHIVVLEFSHLACLPHNAAFLTAGVVQITLAPIGVDLLDYPVPQNMGLVTPLIIAKTDIKAKPNICFPDQPAHKAGSVPPLSYGETLF